MPFMANPVTCELVYGKYNILGLMDLGIYVCISAYTSVEVIELYIVEETSNIPIYFFSNRLWSSG